MDKGVDLVLAGYVLFGAVALTLMSVIIMMIVMIARSSTGRHR